MIAVDSLVYCCCCCCFHSSCRLCSVTLPHFPLCCAVLLDVARCLSFSVCYKPILYPDGWTDWVDFLHVLRILWPILQCVYYCVWIDDRTLESDWAIMLMFLKISWFLASNCSTQVWKRWRTKSCSNEGSAIKFFSHEGLALRSPELLNVHCRFLVVHNIAVNCAWLLLCVLATYEMIAGSLVTT